jgi:hypothetical protein
MNNFNSIRQFNLINENNHNQLKIVKLNVKQELQNIEQNLDR